MARGRKGGSPRSNDNLERVLSNNATAIRAVLQVEPMYQPAPTAYLFSEIEDYRRFHPEGELRHPMRVDGSPSSFGVEYGVPNNKVVRGGTSGLGAARRFRESAGVVVCVRRKERREVLFARGKSGRNSSRRRFNASSGIRCK